jgi:hypothetical protein
MSRLRGGRPSGTQFEAVEVEPARSNKNETIVDAVARLQRRCRELRADLHRVRSAPYPSSIARAKLREEVLRLSERGEPMISAIVELGDGKLQFQREMLRVQMHNIPQAPAAVGYVEVTERDRGDCLVVQE